MKKILLVALLSISGQLLFINNNYAQNAYATTVNYDKNDVPGFSASYNISKSDLEKTFESYFEKNINVKKTKSKNFILFKAANWDAISSEKLDIYYKIEGSKKSSKVILMVSKGYDNYVSETNDNVTAQNITQFLNNFNTHIASYNLTNDIEKQKKVIESLNKDLKSLNNDKESLEKKIKNLQGDIDKTNKKIESKQSDIEKENKVLDNLNSKK